MSIGITGSWINQEDVDRMTPEIYDGMVQDAIGRLHKRGRKPKKNAQLIGGVAPWAEQMAIDIFLKGFANSYFGYAPACGVGQGFFHIENGYDEDKELLELRAKRFQEFCDKCKFQFGANYDALYAFGSGSAGICWCAGGWKDAQRMIAHHSRNTLLCYTWEDGPEPVDPYVRVIWDKCEAPEKIHVPIQLIEAGIITPMPEKKKRKSKKKT